MLIQLVASERGVAALPDWVVAEYEKKGCRFASIGYGRALSALCCDAHIKPRYRLYARFCEFIRRYCEAGLEFYMQIIEHGYNSINMKEGFFLRF